jgi:hypothetical protein
MKSDSSVLISRLIDHTSASIHWALQIQQADPALLSYKPNPESWCVLECIEHLNRYSEYYLPAINNAISHTDSKPDAFYKSGWLGNYFANSMLPKDKLNKMKTFKDKNPLNADLDKQTIAVFIEWQNELSATLHKAEHVSLSKVKVPTSLSQLLKLNLGDTFRFIVNHNIRHMKQADKVLALAQANHF